MIIYRYLPGIELVYIEFKEGATSRTIEKLIKAIRKNIDNKVIPDGFDVLCLFEKNTPSLSYHEVCKTNHLIYAYTTPPKRITPAIIHKPKMALVSQSLLSYGTCRQFEILANNSSAEDGNCSPYIVKVFSDSTEAVEWLGISGLPSLDIFTARRIGHDCP